MRLNDDESARAREVVLNAESTDLLGIPSGLRGKASRAEVCMHLVRCVNAVYLGHLFLVHQAILNSPSLFSGCGM